MGWHEPQEHLSPVDLHTSQAVGDALQHLNLGVTPFGKAIGGVIVKVIQDGLPLSLQGVAPLINSASSANLRLR